MSCKKAGFNNHKIGYALKSIKKGGKTMRAYKCNNCYKYHLTSDINHERSGFKKLRRTSK